METLKMNIEGMGSNHCVMIVRNTLEKLNGAKVKNIEVGKAEVSYDLNIISPNDITQAVEKAGYKVKSA